MVKQREPKNYLEAVAFSFTRWMGSVHSIIVHTILFAASLSLWFFGVELDSVLLILTTAVSLEAIYLSLFIQMTVNRNTQSLEEVEEDVAEIAEDVEEVQKDVDEIQADIDEVQKDIDEVQKDVDEIAEDVEDITEGETADQHRDRVNRESLDKIEITLGKLIQEIEKIKGQK